MYVVNDESSPKSCTNECDSGFFREQNGEFVCADKCMDFEKRAIHENSATQCVTDCESVRLQQFGSSECRTPCVKNA